MGRFKSIKWFLKKSWYKYVICIILTIVSVLLDVVKPKLVGQVIDLIGLSEITFANFKMLMIIIVVVFAARFIVSIFKRIVSGHLFHSIYYELKIRFMNKVLIQDSTFFTKHHSGDLMNRATADTFQMSNNSTQFLFSILEVLLMIAFSAIMMFSIHPLLSIYSIIPLPFIFLVVYKIRPYISKNWRLVRRKNSELSDITMESVQHVKLIRSFVNEEKDYNRLDKVAKECYDIEKKAVYLRSVFGPTFRLCTIISQMVAFIFGSFCVMNQEITVGELITFNLYLAQFSNPMIQLGNQMAMFVQSKVAFDRINEIMDSLPDVMDQKNAKDIETFNQIKFDNFTFRYPETDIDILNNFNLTINKGETIGIVGKTGCGKTTLIKQFLRQYPASDNLTFDNKSVNEITKASVRSLVAYVPQEHALFSRTIEQNLAIGKNKESNLSMDDAILMADFKKDIDFLPDGLNTIVGEYGVTLSGGQKQRLSIARALYKDSEILILDDSLSAVDGTTEANIIRNLKKIRNNKTNIIVAHRLSAVEHADKIVVIENGSVQEIGTHADLMNNKGWYYEQYQKQLMGGEDNE
jgi:ATP-binding cassette subfamily B protein